MATALADPTLRHAVLVEGLKTSQAKKFAPYLVEMERALRERLTREGLSEFQTDRLEGMLADIEAILAGVLGRFTKQLQLDLREFAEFEPIAVAKTYETVGLSITVPLQGIAAHAAFSKPLQAGKGKLLKSFLDDFSKAEIDRLSGRIRLGVMQGETVSQMVTALRGTKAGNYADGLLAISRRNAEAIVRTSVAHVGAVARQETYAANADIFGGETWDATLDVRTCMSCQSLDSRKFDLGKGPVEPLHVNCLPADARVLSRSGITGVSKRWFDGKMVVIRTASNRVLTCTPNHPVLTDGGWVAAKALNLGDKVISDGGSEWTTTVNGDNKNMPALIHEVAESFFSHREVLSMPVPVTAPDFHGDGMDGDIAVIGSYRPLRDGRNAAISQHLEQQSLVLGNAGAIEGVSPCSLGLFSDRVFATTRGIIRLLNKFSTLIQIEARHARELLLTSVSSWNVLFTKGADKDFARYAYALGNTAQTDTLIEEHQGFSQVDGASDAFLCASCSQLAVERSSTDVVLAAEIINGNSGTVFADEIVECFAADFSGHVYNLETVKGFYSANGIITHNCRCVRVPYLNEEFDFLHEGEMRSSEDGPVAGTTSYYDWLKKQPEGFVVQALGRSRGELFLKGGLSAERFARLQLDRNFRALTLEQIKKLEPEAWKRAGLGKK